MNQSITFQLLTPDDFKDVYDVALKSWEYAYRDIYTKEKIKFYIDKYYSAEILENILSQIKLKKVLFLVAKSGSQAIGFCNFIIHNNNQAELLRTYLLPEYIGKGIGGKMLNEGERFLILSGVSKYFCYVHAKNEIGQKFYLKNGFILKGESKNELFDNECDLVFEKVLGV